MFDPNEHMMKFKGKDYLQVAWRLVWFRDEHPDWCINTECVEQDKEHAIFKAYICDENGIQKSSGHGSESKHDFGDYLEKAETKAIGRALAMLGYGTQFAADELDEGQRIVDSPINRTPNQPDIQTEKQDVQIKVNDTLCECCGAPIEGIRAGDKLISASEVIAKSRTKYGKALCYNCCKTMLKEAS